jgi:hypothetical protein
VQRTLGTLITCTTYGTWLRGDRRHWVEDAITLPPNPPLEQTDRSRLKSPPCRFATDQLFEIADVMGRALVDRKHQRVFALTVQASHIHFVIGPTPVTMPQVVKCAKDSARWLLKTNRPIWTRGYDKQFCFTEQSLLTRIRYVENHNLQNGWPTQPWDWLTPINNI